MNCGIKVPQPPSFVAIHCWEDAKESVENISEDALKIISHHFLLEETLDKCEKVYPDIRYDLGIKKYSFNHYFNMTKSYDIVDHQEASCEANPEDLK